MKLVSLTKRKQEKNCIDSKIYIFRSIISKQIINDIILFPVDESNISCDKIQYLDGVFIFEEGGIYIINIYLKCSNLNQILLQVSNEFNNILHEYSLCSNSRQFILNLDKENKIRLYNDKLTGLCSKGMISIAKI